MTFAEFISEKFPGVTLAEHREARMTWEGYEPETIVLQFDKNTTAGAFLRLLTHAANPRS